MTTGKGAHLKLIPLVDILDHPKNPRLYDREEVIDAIAACLDGEYPQKHAVHVRPLPRGKYQLVSGHHRKKAALKKGLKAVWAWVEDMTDEEALMQLVLANNQGELTPLEIGLHVLQAVPPGKAGRGRKGGISEYARQIGRTQQYVSQLRNAAEVADWVGATESTSWLVDLVDRAQHLAALHAADRDLWPVLVHELLAESRAAKAADRDDPWTVGRTRKVLEKLAACLAECPERWRGSYLRPDLVAQAVVQGAGPDQFIHLARLATYIADRISDNKKALPEGTAEGFERLLADGAGTVSWDMRYLQGCRLGIEEHLGNPPPPAGLYRLLLTDVMAHVWDPDSAMDDSREAGEHYPRKTVDVVKRLQVPAAEDSVLFMWAPPALLPEALEVMEAWGFTYLTGAAWVKPKPGEGRWFRGQHELLLVGIRGRFRPPEPARRFPSVIRGASPDVARELLERMFPDFTERERVELFPRTKRLGWSAWTNEWQDEEEE
jgi:N6-adenosine-specific RNA methylase IME4